MLGWYATRNVLHSPVMIARLFESLAYSSYL